jgi:hypothetical protein
LPKLSCVIVTGESGSRSTSARAAAVASASLRDLDRDFATVLQVLGEVHGGHAAAPELALEAIAARHGGREALWYRRHGVIGLPARGETSRRTSGFCDSEYAVSTAKPRLVQPLDEGEAAMERETATPINRPGQPGRGRRRAVDAFRWRLMASA